jgi:hypothetical protein
MSKKWKKMAEHLEANGKRAPATVVKVSHYGTETGGGGFGVLDLVGLGSTNEEWTTHKTRLRVRPDDEPEFEVETKMTYAKYTVPDAEEEIEVLYDPADHENIMVAPPKPAEYDPEKGLAETKVGFTLDLSRLGRKKK